MHKISFFFHSSSLPQKYEEKYFNLMHLKSAVKHRYTFTAALLNSSILKYTVIIKHSVNKTLSSSFFVKSELGKSGGKTAQTSL
jgi:hypothetical protein